MIIQDGNTIKGGVFMDLENIKIHLVFRNATTDKLGYYGMTTPEHEPMSIKEFILMIQKNCLNGTPITILEFRTE